MTNILDFENMEAKPYKPLSDVARKVAADGAVLLKNENNVLPIKENEVISVFGRTQIDYIKSGTGSGGLVHCEYVINILDGIRENKKLKINEDLVEIYTNWLKENPFDEGPGWAQEPWCQKEMVPTEEMAKNARKNSDVAVIVIGRTAGEDRDNSAEKGSWYLTDEEEALLKIVSKHFEKTVVLLNVGNIIDMKWVEKYNIKSVMYIWQGGQEGGRAVADLICGDAVPSGKLADTIAKDISLYPTVKNFGSEEFNLYEEDIYVGYRYFETFAKEDVLYPFGFGLSYTNFETKVKKVCQNADYTEIDVTVKNTGTYSGREVIEVYFEAPQGKLGKSTRELCAFAKTKILAPEETQNIYIKIKTDDMCSYDDSGITGNKSAFVMEEGEYNIYLGKCVRCAEKIFSFQEPKTRVIRKCHEAMAPVKSFKIMHPVFENGEYKVSYKDVSAKTVDYEKRIAQNLPEEITFTGDMGIKLADVKSGENTLKEFVAQLDDIDLMCLVRGEGMCSPKVRPGSAGAVGGLTKSLLGFGVPAAALHDGPSGIRMDNGEKATSLPNGTCIACSWDEDLSFELYKNLSAELTTHSIDSILGPGVNIHRVPLNGRNFEYLSEDPYLTGKIGAALIKGVDYFGNSATVKHFAVNSQEKCRRDVDSVVSERALREIYLKCFEIAVKEGNAKSLMTSYNPVNDIWTANNYDLNTIILRDEWGYDGFVMTDWWPKLEKGKGIKEDVMTLKHMVKAQNDVYMPTPDGLAFSDDLESALKAGEITRGQLQRNAMNVLKYIMNSRSMDRFLKYGTTIETSLAESIELLKSMAQVTEVEAEKTYELKTQNPGKKLLCIEYSSSEASVTQMTISFKINGTDGYAVTVNGTGGKVKKAHIDFSSETCEIKVCAAFPKKLMNIKKIEIMEE